MERRNLRRVIAQQLEGEILSADHIALMRSQILGAEPSDEDTKEFVRQLDFVLEPLVKKLRRAQGQGKQTGHLLTEEAGNVMVGSPIATAPDLSTISAAATALVH